MNAINNYNWLVDNTNVVDAHRAVSREFANNATSVVVQLRVNGESHKTEIMPWETIYTKFERILSEELNYSAIDSISIEFASCTSDAADWVGLS